MQIDDTVSLVINGTTWQGWKSIRISRGIDRMPSDFSISLTERFPGSATNIDIMPGNPLVLKIGSDVVLTGYVDRYSGSIDPQSHAVEITGRGKCQDLVDCAAIFTGQQVMQSTALGLAQIICKPFGITVTGPANTRAISQFNTVLTETPHAIIERITRYSALLAYEGTDGNLVLGPVGTAEAASGFAQGVNIQSARCTLAMDQRFSAITVILTSIDTQWHTSQADGDIGLSAANTVYTAKDGGVPRYRPHLVASEQTDSILATAQQRANWEVARRFGESQAIILVCDSWRDSAGALWQINTLASLDVPALKITGAKWIIAQVTFIKDLSRGTIAELKLMPPQAFNPEPIILYPFDQQLAQDLAGPQP